jgi:hypothetical protein
MTSELQTSNIFQGVSVGTSIFEYRGQSDIIRIYVNHKFHSEVSMQSNIRVGFSKFRTSVNEKLVSPYHETIRIRGIFIDGSILPVIYLRENDDVYLKIKNSNL